MNISKVSIVLMTFCFAREASAAWVSSGGNALDDATNPWWLKNTPAVSYCVDVDEIAVSATRAQVEVAVERALSYWQTEFGREDGEPTHAIATQRFTRVACDEATAGEPALRVQVGPSTLSAEQSAYLGNRIAGIVGIAVRTAYDEVNLRGRGFIYVAADPQQLIDWHAGEMFFRPWSHAQRLERVLVHELGHVFGLPHIPGTLMDEWAPNHWFRDDFFDDRATSIPAFSGTSLSNATCTLTGINLRRTRAYFDLPVDANCLAIEIDRTELSGRVFAGKRAGEALAPIGTVDFSRIGVGANGQSLVQIHLNPRQQVFQTAATVIYGNMASWVTMAEEAIYRSGAQTKQMLISRDLTRYHIFGLVDTGQGPAISTVLSITRRFGDWVP